eukprot:CAMPEP_0170495778 /NCGR_PEP_ID=MMETSP0208-20121228/18549_1 /TAXON_ID=197538 /ORGANISM="Strombidium inclinatum, Strain S3" /LENGTH=86 /DNA_ID=CAMNT_0010772139 /DNA_START=972 /DNA_END=1228 /DNA_ORIENTATION=-
MLEEAAEQVQQEYEAPPKSQIGGAGEDARSQAPSVTPSQLKDVFPTMSQFSKMSGKTYISMLHHQLEDERQARLRLEKELQELRKV